ncbi:MAG TPA: restriction endonuclease subunit S [Gammaproteobacteria bacterium]
MKLADCAEITTGHPFRSRIAALPGSGTVAVQMKDVSSYGDILWTFATETQPVTVSPAWLEDGDILLAARGNQNRAVLVKNPPKSLAAPHWYVIRCHDNKLLPAFLVWQMNRKPAQNWFRRESTGTATRNLRQESVANLEIAVPPLEEQRRIIAIAEAARKEREICERLMTATETLNDGLARRLLKSTRNRKVS